MKRVSFDTATLHSRVDEARVKVCVVAYQDGAVAALVANFLADGTEHFAQGLGFVHGLAKRVMGVDAGKIQRRLFNVCAFEWVHIEAEGAVYRQVPVVIHAHQGGRNLQDRVRRGDKSAGLDINDDRKKSPEPVCNALGMFL